ncbi:hypothetical protein ACIGHN_27920 [Acidovorax sp. NPDC077693]|uniref:hypothetical protein n=1 Tax=unclassified Acidovorax TaxID=2684926 RepID=UPI0037C6AAB6
MSVDVASYIKELPQNWKQLVCAEMKLLGFSVELHPYFDPIDPNQDTLWARVIDFSRLIGTQPNADLLVGCGFSYASGSSVESRGRWRLYPPEARGKVHLLGLHSASGRSRLTVALQLSFAAALATVADGAFHDQVNDVVYLPGSDLRNFIQNQMHDLTESGSMPFESWPPIDPDEAAEYDFPSEIS